MNNLASLFSALSQDENSMGRFLKNESQRDKTRAGKMMAAVGKTQSHASQQRFVGCCAHYLTFTVLTQLVLKLTCFCVN